jgi:hypothetical protein
MTHYERTWHLKIDINKIKNLIDSNQHRFICPFSNEDSYLNIYKKRECDVKFLNIQHCNYSLPSTRDGEKYIKYLMSVERKIKNNDNYIFLKHNYDKFTVETNEENFNVDDDDPSFVSLVEELKSMWAFDASKRPSGNISRVRIVKLPAGGTMPYHRDETSSSNLRIICPIVTNDKILNSFRDKSGEVSYNFPATGHFYTFQDDKIEHAVFNNSDEDRYALIFTVKDIQNLKEWDRRYYKHQKFLEAWKVGN